MTDRIDLDELETGDDEDEPAGNRGDWLWRDDGSDPASEADPPSAGTDTESDSAGNQPTAAGSKGIEADDIDADTDTDADATTEPDRTPAPHVPDTGESTPVGIPKRGGDSSGSTSASGSARAGGETTDSETASMRPMGAGSSSDAESEQAAASGPHGGGADDMTMAITYGALRRLAHPAAVFASAYEWSDWVGIVGDVPAHVVQKFQRDHGIDVDFFNGTGTDPAERLADMDRNSMFYADRMVVVGVAGEDDHIAAAADWEFVPLETAADKADWELEDH